MSAHLVLLHLILPDTLVAAAVAIPASIRVPIADRHRRAERDGLGVRL